MSLQERAEQLAKISLGIGAIKLNSQQPFLWASGFYMPIYNDNRMLLADAKHRRFVADGFVHLINQVYSMPDIIAGTSTSGIPPATTVADIFGRPLIYIRDKPKEHGMKNQIEGIDSNSDLSGRSVVLIEDLISKGGSSASAVQAIRNAKGEIDYCFSIFNYGLDEAREVFLGKLPLDRNGAKLDKPCNTSSLLTYDVLLAVAKENDYIKQGDITTLEEWRADPWNWGAKHGFPPVKK